MIFEAIGKHISSVDLESRMPFCANSCSSYSIVEQRQPGLVLWDFAIEERIWASSNGTLGPISGRSQDTRADLTVWIKRETSGDGDSKLNQKFVSVLLEIKQNYRCEQRCPLWRADGRDGCFECLFYARRSLIQGPIEGSNGSIVPGIQQRHMWGIAWLDIPYGVLRTG